ncbi:VOC family protein [Bacillus sp. FJAT-49711]|uniref:VOC family protein n=1 Tax=Bacillus sp. FJAT-49711 TaxID=2833585 RepID=UPI001BCA3A73|nr:VOC family protein [Bacillus sp. FJAT-49711]MBS4218628.1 VOC family protein [Bacillus sp. FJAT-49711]
MMKNNIQKIGQIGIPVKDLNRAVKFYKEVLLLPMPYTNDTMAFFVCDEIRLFLSLPEKEEFAHPSSVIYFQVENIHHTYEDWQASGIAFISEPHLIAKIGDIETWMAFFKDTEENTHAIMSEVTV